MNDWRGLLENDNEAALLAASCHFFGVAPHSYFPAVFDPFEKLALDQALYLAYRRVEAEAQEAAEKEAERADKARRSKENPGSVEYVQPPSVEELQARMAKT